MSEFEPAFQYILRNEKGLVNHPKDPGKITKFGISLRFMEFLSQESLKFYGYSKKMTEDDIKNLTIETALKIYFHEFWQAAPFKDIMGQIYCNYIFDMAISMGIVPAIKCVQRAHWAVMAKQQIVDDGILGPETLSAINHCTWMLMPALRSERAGYYRRIAATEKEDGIDHPFLKGWLKRAYESP